MGTARFIFGLICLIGVVGYRVPDSSVLAQKTQQSIRNNIINIASSQIGVREATGNNDGCLLAGKPAAVSNICHLCRR